VPKPKLPRVPVPPPTKIRTDKRKKPPKHKPKLEVEHEDQPS
jgi:hypothetical protein